MYQKINNFYKNLFKKNAFLCLWNIKYKIYLISLFIYTSLSINLIKIILLDEKRLKDLEQEQEILLNKISKNVVEHDHNDSSFMNSKIFSLVNNYQYTSDLIQLYNNLNNKYRYDAYESLGFIKEIQNMTEFKLKLLFSVVVVSILFLRMFVKTVYFYLNFFSSLHLDMLNRI